MRPLRIILSGINLLLLAAFWPVAGELLATDRVEHAAYKASPAPVPTPHPQAAQPDLTRLLFRAEPSRIERDDAPPDVGLASGRTMRLVGIVLTDQRRVAVLDRDGTILRVAEGDQVDGWQVTRIERRKIRLQNAEQQIDVPLDRSTDTP